MSGKRPPLVAAIDLGNDRFKALVAAVLPDGGLALEGVGEKPAAGMRRGVVVDLEQVIAAAGDAVKEAEIMSRARVSEALVSISGAHIVGMETTGVAAVPDHEISASEVAKVRETAGAVRLEGGASTLHLLEREYRIDEQGGVRRPEGMTGSRLEGRMHLVLASSNALANLEKCLLRIGAQPSEIVFAGLAAADAALTEDEKKLGVCVLDIGAGLTEIVAFRDGVVLKTAALEMAGRDMDNDVAQMFHTSLESAERAKKITGVTDSEGEPIAVSDAGGGGETRIGRQTLAQTVAARVEEILEKAQNEIADLGALPGGIVFCGDGALLPGLEEAGARAAEHDRAGGAPAIQGAELGAGVAPALCGGDGAFAPRGGNPARGDGKARRRGFARVGRRPRVGGTALLGLSKPNIPNGKNNKGA